MANKCNAVGRERIDPCAKHEAFFNVCRARCDDSCSEAYFCDEIWDAMYDCAYGDE